MKILVACEESQAVTIELRKLGHEAYSCDILDCSGGHPEWHIKGDVLKPLWSEKWDLVIAHPPCTYLCNSGVRWLVSEKQRDGYEYNENLNLYVDYQRFKHLELGADFFNKFVLYGKLGNAIAIENPIMHKYAAELVNCDYAQLIQPYQFGHMEKKATCLWLFNLNLLAHTNNVYDGMMALPYAERSKVHYASPGNNRAKLRSKTYPGIASAMAKQWTDPL